MANPELDPRIGYHEPSGRRVYPQQFINGRAFIPGALQNAPTALYIAPEVPERYFVFLPPGIASITEVARAELMASIDAIPRQATSSARKTRLQSSPEADESEDE